MYGLIIFRVSFLLNRIAFFFVFESNISTVHDRCLFIVDPIEITEYFADLSQNKRSDKDVNIAS